MLNAVLNLVKIGFICKTPYEVKPKSNKIEGTQAKGKQACL